MLPRTGWLETQGMSHTMAHDTRQQQWSHLQFVFLCVDFGELFHFLLQAGHRFFQLVGLGLFPFSVSAPATHSPSETRGREQRSLEEALNMNKLTSV